MTDKPQPFQQQRRREFIVFRKGTHYPRAERMPMGELNTHYRRLCRVGNVDLWKIVFGTLCVLLLGAIAGAVASGSVAGLAVAIMAGFAVLSFVGWYAVRDTEAETVKAIREDFKRDILDTFELIELSGEVGDELSPDDSQVSG